MIAAAVTTMVGVSTPAIASAAKECMHQFGSQQQLVDAGGAVVQGWTVTDLKRSADPAPGYPLAGQLWEATASVKAVSGTVTPIVPNFRAHSMDGGSYQTLWQVASPQGISGATIAQGQTSTGKLYFDVTGGEPMGVMYTGAGARPLMWCCNGGMMNMPEGMMTMPEGMMTMPEGMMTMPEGMMSMPMDNCPCPMCVGQRG
jgi:hypothetical protein